MDSLNSALPDEKDPPDALSFARLGATADLAALQAEVRDLLEQDWVGHVNRNDYSGTWDVLPLRCQRQHLEAHPILQGFALMTGSDWENLPRLAQCPRIQEVLQGLHCPIQSVRLMRLKAGAEIKPHRDLGLSVESGEVRLHMPIFTSDAVSFIVNHQRMPMCAGELWYLNADQVHEVYNRGSEDRINLVIDCVANDWLRARITAAAEA